MAIEKFFLEGEKYLDEGDTVQASEKLYKAVEEGIKLLARKQNLPEYEQAEKDGRWQSKLLVRAAGRLARDLERREIRDAWLRAFHLHVWGFHECALGIEDIRQDLPSIRWLVNYAKGKIDLI